MAGWLKRLFGSKGDNAPFADARRHHYFFAHHCLRQMLFEDHRLVGILAGEDGNRFLRDVWDELGEKVEAHGEERLPGGGLEVAAKGRMGNFYILMVRLPEPVGVTEAYYIAAALGPLPDDESDEALFAAPMRYFTLEVGVSFGPPRAVLGEWTEDSHLNYGDGPAPEPGAFAARVVELLG